MKAKIYRKPCGCYPVRELMEISERAFIQKITKPTEQILKCLHMPRLGLRATSSEWNAVKGCKGIVG